MGGKTGGGAPKPRMPITGRQPFHSMERAEVSGFATRTLQVSLTLPLTSLSDSSAVQTAALKLLLHRPYETSWEVGSSAGVSEGSVVVDVLSLTPLSDTVRQVVGKPFFSVCALVKVRTAVVDAGVQLGVALDAPYADTFRVRLLRRKERVPDSARSVESDVEPQATPISTPESQVVLCRCGADEPVTRGYTVIVAFEPNLIKCVAFRPPRVSPGSWTRELDSSYRLHMTFTLDPLKQVAKRHREPAVVCLEVPPVADQVAAMPEVPSQAQSVEPAKQPPQQRVQKLRGPKQSLAASGTKQTFEDSDDD